MIGSLIGGATQIAGSIFGGIAASRAMKKVKKNLEQRKEANENWFNRRYNEDATQRADAQRILAKTEESIRNRNRQAAGAAAVMGGTEESIAAAKASNNEALAEAASQIAASAGARKDNIESQYQARDAQLDDALNNLEQNKAQNIASTVQGIGSAASSIAGAFL